MNISLIDTIRSRSSMIASAALIVVAATLAVSALMAQGPSKATAPTQIPNCLGNWPPADPTQNQWVKDAFDTALSVSATPGQPNDPGPTLRRALLDPKNNFKSPKDAIKKILDTQHPNNNINFPSDLVIIFYEEEPQSSPTPAPNAKSTTPLLHPNHCYLVLYLDQVGSIAPTAPSDSRAHVMCCYDPY